VCSAETSPIAAIAPMVASSPPTTTAAQREERKSVGKRCSATQPSAMTWMRLMPIQARDAHHASKPRPVMGPPSTSVSPGRGRTRAWPVRAVFSSRSHTAHSATPNTSASANCTPGPAEPPTAPKNHSNGRQPPLAPSDAVSSFLRTAASVKARCHSRFQRRRVSAQSQIASRIGATRRRACRGWGRRA
jgi:hypothetical protein